MAPGGTAGVDLLLERDGLHVCRSLPGKLVNFHAVESELVFVLLNLFHSLLIYWHYHYFAFHSKVLEVFAHCKNVFELRFRAGLVYPFYIYVAYPI